MPAVIAHLSPKSVDCSQLHTITSWTPARFDAYHGVYGVDRQLHSINGQLQPHDGVLDRSAGCNGQLLQLAFRMAEQLARHRITVLCGQLHARRLDRD